VSNKKYNNYQEKSCELPNLARLFKGLKPHKRDAQGFFSGAYTKYVSIKNSAEQ